MNLEGTNNTRYFFIAQAVGWAIFGVVNATVQSLIGTPFEFVVANAIYSVIAGLLVSTAYRYLIKDISWAAWRMVPLLVFILFSSFALSVAWLLVSYVFFAISMPGLPFSFYEILTNVVNGGLIYLVWNLIYFFFKYFAKSQQLTIDKWRLLAEAKEAQLGHLKAHLRPHFVFNALNNIKALVLEDPQRSRDMLINFSDLLRYSLQHDKNKLVSLADELDISRQYLELMSIQFEDRLNWSISVSEEATELLLPPMSLQMLVENAVKHGIAVRKEAGRIEIETRLVDHMLHLTVKNTGRLDAAARMENRLGTGIQNLRERLQIMYRGKAAFDLREAGQYVIAQVQIPQMHV